MPLRISDLTFFYKKMLINPNNKYTFISKLVMYNNNIVVF
jgi:hypothetical protein